MIEKHRFFGWGPGNFKVFYPLFHHRIVTDQLFNENSQPRYLHNDFLQVAVEAGLVGLFLYVSLLVYAFSLVFRLLRIVLSTNKRFLVLGIGAGLAGLVVQSLLSFPLYQALPPLLLYLFLALLIVIIKGEDYGCNSIRNKFPSSFSIVLSAVIVVGIFYYVFSQMSVWQYDRHYRQLLDQEARGSGIKCLLRGCR